MQDSTQFVPRAYCSTVFSGTSSELNRVLASRNEGWSRNSLGWAAFSEAGRNWVSSFRKRTANGSSSTFAGVGAAAGADSLRGKAALSLSLILPNQALIHVANRSPTKAADLNRDLCE